MATIDGMNSFGGRGIGRPVGPGRMTLRFMAAAMTFAALTAACGSSVDGGDGGDEDAALSSETTDEAANDPTTDGSADGDQPEEEVATTVDAADPSADSLADAEASAAAFSQCLRDQGVDIADLEISADGSLDLGNLVGSVDPEDPEVQQAMLACQSMLSGGLGSSLNDFLTSQTFEDALAGFSDCVRNEDYDVKTLTLDSLVAAMLSGDPGPDPRGIDGSVDPILATALGLDANDIDVLNTIDGCADAVQAGLADLNLGSLAGDS